MKKRVQCFDVLLGLVMFFIILFTLYPFWHQVVISFDTSVNVNASGFKLFPQAPSAAAYQIVFGYRTLWRGFGNSLLRVALGTSLTLMMTMLTAYPLSKQDLPFRHAYTTFLFITMLIGGGLIPNYLLIRYLGLMNSVWALVVPGMMSAYNVFVVRNFYKTLPVSIEESAMIDGAGWLTIWVRLVLPLSTPVMAVVTLWSAVGHWNAWFDVLLYIFDGNKLTLPVILRRILIDDTSTMADFEKLSKAAMSGSQLQGKSIEAAILAVSITPMLILYPFLQKYFVRGIQVGSIKE